MSNVNLVKYMIVHCIYLASSGCQLWCANGVEKLKHVLQERPWSHSVQAFGVNSFGPLRSLHGIVVTCGISRRKGQEASKCWGRNLGSLPASDASDMSTSCLFSMETYDFDLIFIHKTTSWWHGIQTQGLFCELHIVVGERWANFW